MRGLSKLWRKLRRIVLAILVAATVAPIALTFLYRALPPPLTPLMVIRAFEGEGLDKDWVPLSRISPHAVRSVVALEDSRFCSHSGVDWTEVSNAVADRLKGARLRGASTISMQTAKNLFLWPNRTFLRKAVEAPATYLIEWAMGKRRILEIYLNVVEWGPGVYGVEAAARRYFGKPAARLTRREAGLLAAVLPNPRRWSPTSPTDYIRERARTAMTRAAALGPHLRCATRQG